MSTSAPHEGPENRIDPKNQLFAPDQQAARAFARFEKLEPATRREAIKTADFREGESMRAKLTQYLDQIDGIKTPEQVELLNKLIAQYDSSVATWKRFGIETEGDLLTKGIPAKQEVTAWLNSLSAKTLKNLAVYGEPRLKFIPPAKTRELFEAINKNKNISGQKESQIYWAEGWKDVGSKKWQFGLTVDTEDMPFDPKIYYVNGVDGKDGAQTNEQMVHLYEQKFQEGGMDMMPQEAYVPSAMDAMARGKVLDKKYWTAFKRPKGTVCLPFAYWRDGRVGLSRECS